jgi:hypothetical protein
VILKEDQVDQVQQIQLQDHLLQEQAVEVVQVIKDNL